MQDPPPQPSEAPQQPDDQSAEPTQEGDPTQEALAKPEPKKPQEQPSPKKPAKKAGGKASSPPTTPSRNSVKRKQTEHSPKPK